MTLTVDASRGFVGISGASCVLPLASTETGQSTSDAALLHLHSRYIYSQQPRCRHAQGDRVEDSGSVNGGAGCQHLLYSPPGA